MLETLIAIAEGFERTESGFVHKFGDGYELCLEQLIFDEQWYLALYKDQSLLIPKVVVRIGKEQYMHTPESTTHSYCEWHTKHGGGIAECCECYPAETCERKLEVKEDDTVLTIDNKEDGEEPVEVMRIHAVYQTISDKRKRYLCYNMIWWANEELKRLDPDFNEKI